LRRVEGRNAMRVRGSGRRQSRLSRAALLLGLGALSAAGARADAAESLPGVGDVVIRSNGGQIYLSESGMEFQELQIADATLLRVLQQLIAESGTDAGRRAIRLPPLILAGDGGSGFHWAPADRTAPAASRKARIKPHAPVKAGGGASPERTQPVGRPAGGGSAKG